MIGIPFPVLGRILTCFGIFWSWYFVQYFTFTGVGQNSSSMKKLLSLSIVALSVVLFGCPKKDPQPEVKEDGVPLKDYIGITFGSKPFGVIDDMTGFQHPECGKEVEFKHIKMTMFDEDVSDTRPCSGKVLDNYFSPGPGTTVVFDVSYYSKIRSISFSTVDGCTPGNYISLVDRAGKEFKRVRTSWRDAQVSFLDQFQIDLSQLKQIRFHKTCEGGPGRLLIFGYD